MLITNYPEEVYPDLLLIMRNAKKESKVAMHTKASLITNYNEGKKDWNIGQETLCFSRETPQTIFLKS